jgi:hypothetical protein
MFPWAGLSAVNPWLLAGAAAIAAPIIIHLLSKRKFRILDWAAMDFLLEAERKNRRRVRMENFIILLLRCLAIALIALLAARPFYQPPSMAQASQEGATIGSSSLMPRRTASRSSLKSLRNRTRATGSRCLPRLIPKRRSTTRGS